MGGYETHNVKYMVEQKLAEEKAMTSAICSVLILVDSWWFIDS